jgi:FemAB-related protein (PEP-CTERM system-associated)
MTQNNSEKLVLKALSPINYQRWDDFVRSAEHGTFFHLSGWKEIFETVLGHETYYFLVERGDDIVGVLPLARVRSWLFGDALISVTFLVYGGPIVEHQDASELLLINASELAKKLNVDYLELRNRAQLTDWPSKTSYVTFRKAISSNPEENFLAIPRKQRAVIRKAIKADLSATIDENVDNLYATLTECKRNLGTPFFSRRYLQTVHDTFGDNCEILTVRRGGEVLSSVMSFRFRNEILPYYGGGGLSARRYGANDFMYWKVMENACESGTDIFDFGRSLRGSGAYKFKKYWGFEPEPLSYEYLLVGADSMPQLDPTNKRYQHLINIWTKLPLKVAQLIGPSIARRLG